MSCKPAQALSANSQERNLTVTYLNTRGVHSCVSATSMRRAGYVSTWRSSTLQPYAFGNVGNIFEYQCRRCFPPETVDRKFQYPRGRQFSLFGFYVLNYADSDTAGPSSFSSIRYFWVRTMDVRASIFATASFLAVPWLCRTLSVSVRFSSRSPDRLSISPVPTDLNGTTVFQLSPVLRQHPANPPM